MFQIPSSKRGDPWFEDGNIILVADGEDESNSIAFKVHRGVLARHSEVFESMLVVAQPPPDTETVEQCSVLRMHDIPIELSNLVKALYDGPVHLYVRLPHVYCYSSEFADVRRGLGSQINFQVLRTFCISLGS